MTIQKIPRDYLDVGKLDKAAANIEIVREAYRGADAGSFERFYASFAEDAVGYEAEGIPYGGVYPGKEGCIRLNEALFKAWESLSWNVLELTGGGDIVVVHLEMTFKPKGGEAIKHPIMELWRFRDGKIIEIRPFYYDTHLIRQVLSKASASAAQR